MYEYFTRRLPYPEGTSLTAEEALTKSTGYYRIFADVTTEGVFAVYRREKRETAEERGRNTVPDLPAIRPTQIVSVGAIVASPIVSVGEPELTWDELEEINRTPGG